MKTILFFGDSITDTSRSRENDSNFGMGYPTLVKGELTFDYPNQYILYNRGISGNRVVDLYARIKQDAINLKPDVMSILIGVNDVWHEFSRQNGVDADKYFKVYSMLIEEIKEALPDVKIMILEPFVLEGVNTEDTETCPNKWKLFSTEVKKRAVKSKEIAEKYNLPFISLQDKFDEVAKLAPNNYWLYDGVHPTTAGHELIKREWMKVFNKL
ncbi:MAG: SGNH/GDSL hydrolase family protein [Lachnospiraceae bacterium]|nr:SGNH/GDSL hydrolase family protein [Lachnospiraceae bacterium]